MITLIDLQNAFGEVHHEFIQSVLRYHHMPPEICSLIGNLYQDYHISVATEKFTTNPIRVSRGVLQGDCLSPLIFNLCVNTLVNTIKDERIKCLGYVYNITLPQRHWFQFADDTAIATAL